MMKQYIIIMADQNNRNQNFKLLIGIYRIMIIHKIIQIHKNFFLTISRNVFFSYQTNHLH